MNEAFLLIGGNMGNRQDYLFKARTSIGSSVGTILEASSVYETAAWGKEDQSAFLNQVLKVGTILSPQELLASLLDIEKQLGRQRMEKYGPRIIDLDILFFNDAVIQKKGLVIPHPQLQNRRFVLEPLTEIAPGKIHPVLHKNSATLLAECADTLPVHKIN